MSSVDIELRPYLQKHRAVLVDLFIAIGIPILIMVLRASVSFLGFVGGD